MTLEFAKVCKRLILASAVAVIAPLATAALLGATQAATESPAEQTQPAPHSMTIADLGRARAVSWISTGHIAAH